MKALHSSIKPEAFVEQFLSLGLGPRTFGNVKLDTRHIPELRNPILVLAKLLWDNDAPSIMKSLSNFKSNKSEIEAVLFLKFLYDKFHEFDKLVFDPTIDGKWLSQLYNKKKILFTNGVLSAGEVMVWSKIMNLKSNLTKSFINYNSPLSAKDFPGMKPGAELGNKISIENAKFFLKSL